MTLLGLQVVGKGDGVREEMCCCVVRRKSREGREDQARYELYWHGLTKDGEDVARLPVSWNRCNSVFILPISFASKSIGQHIWVKILSLQ